MDIYRITHRRQRAARKIEQINRTKETIAKLQNRLSELEAGLPAIIEEDNKRLETIAAARAPAEMFKNGASITEIAAKLELSPTRVEQIIWRIAYFDCDKDSSRADELFSRWSKQHTVGGG
jgi:DnaJ-domain-containing protein 1